MSTLTLIRHPELQVKQNLETKFLEPGPIEEKIAYTISFALEKVLNEFSSRIVLIADGVVTKVPVKIKLEVEVEPIGVRVKEPKIIFGSAPYDYLSRIATRSYPSSLSNTIVVKLRSANLIDDNGITEKGKEALREADANVLKSKTTIKTLAKELCHAIAWGGPRSSPRRGYLLREGLIRKAAEKDLEHYYVTEKGKEWLASQLKYLLSLKTFDIYYRELVSVFPIIDALVEPLSSRDSAIREAAKNRYEELTNKEL